MNGPFFKEAAYSSLDADLKEMIRVNQAEAAEAVLLQMLRIMRGRPFNVELQPKSEGHWSADGKKWLPKAPGT